MARVLCLWVHFIIILQAYPDYYAQTVQDKADCTYVPIPSDTASSCNQDCINNNGCQTCLYAMGSCMVADPGSVTISDGTTSYTVSNDEEVVFTWSSDLILTIRFTPGTEYTDSLYVISPSQTMTSPSSGYAQSIQCPDSVGNKQEGGQVDLLIQPTNDVAQFEVTGVWAPTKGTTYGIHATINLLNTVPVPTTTVLPAGCSGTSPPETTSPETTASETTSAPEDGVVIPNDQDLHLTVTADASAKTMTIHATSLAQTSTDWFSVALSADSSMNSGDIAYVYSDGDVFVQALGDHSGGNQLTDTQVEWESGTDTNQNIYFSVTLPTVEYTQYNFGSADTEFVFLFAKGSGSYSYHSGRGFATGYTVASIEAGTADGDLGSAEPSTKQSLHAFTMFIAWGVCVPVAVLAASTKGIVPQAKHNIGVCCDDHGVDDWFNVHRVANGLAVVLSIIGLGIGWDMNNQDHLSFKHAKIGFSICVLAVAQPLIAYFRPGKDAPGREYFNLYHISVGMYCLIMGLQNIRWGFDQMEKYGNDHTDEKKTAVLVWMVFVLVMWAGSTVYTYGFKKKGGYAEVPGQYQTLPEDKASSIIN